MSESTVFMIQPRDECPGDHHNYRESKYMNYSNCALSLIDVLKIKMSEHRKKTEENNLIIDNLKKLVGVHKERGRQYTEIQDSYIELQGKILEFSKSLGRINQRQNLIDSRNKIINNNLSVDKIIQQVEDANKNDGNSFDGSKSGKTKSELDKHQEKLKDIREKYFNDNILFNGINEELKRRKEENDKLLNEIDRTNRRMFADSMNRLYLRKL